MIGKWMSIDSQEYKDLMEKWGREAYAEEMSDAEDEYYASEDLHGRLPKERRIL